MARLPRLGVAGWPHLITQRVHEGQVLARDDTDRQMLIDALREAARQHAVAVHAYRLGASALVLLVTPERAESVSLFMQALGRRYVAAHNRRHGRQGGLWAGRYRGTVLDPAQHLLDAMVFTETPESGEGTWLAGESAGSRWSSAPHHLGLRSDPLVSDSPVFWTLGNTPFERQAAWRRRLQEGLGQARQRELAEAAHKGWALLPAERQQALAQLLGRPLSPRPRGRPRKSI